MSGHHLDQPTLASPAEAEIAASYTALLEAEPALAAETYEELVRGEDRDGLRFDGRLLCTVLRPRFMRVERLARLAREAAILAAVFERAGEALLASDAMLDLVHADELERELWSVDPGYSGFTLTSRLDTFMVGNQPHVVEYNAESPASIGFNDVLTTIFQSLPAFRRWQGGRRLGGFNAREALTEALLWAYREWGGTGRPAIAIIDWEHVPTRRDFELCAEYFRDKGMVAEICDPRALTYEGGALRLNGRRIDLVYRRVLLHELLDKADEAQPLLQAYRDGAVCIVNSPRSKLLHKKSVLALLDDGVLDLGLSDEERDIIGRSIPWTRRLTDGATTYRGETVDLATFVVDNRDRLVLKPSDDYGGRGVRLGWEIPDDEWRRAVEEAIGEPYVVQERVPVPRGAFPVWRDGALAVEDLIVDTDPLLFRGELGGILTRMSGSALLNVTAGTGSTAPTFVVEGDE